MKKITAWECEYCGKIYYKSRSSCRSHEQICYWNPGRKACASCGNLNLGKDDFGCNYIFCGYHEKYLVTSLQGIERMGFRRNCPQWKERACQ
jgi:hypothetical protein